jgi:hypothetical protein
MLLFLSWLKTLPCFLIPLGASPEVSMEKAHSYNSSKKELPPHLPQGLPVLLERRGWLLCTPGQEGESLA